MRIKQFYKLMKRNWLLLITIPLTTAASIYFFTRNQDQKYVSDTVLYTGITSGYKIDGGNNKAGGWNTDEIAFGNLMSLINSRKMKEEVGLRLLASHLMLKQHDPAVLTFKSYQTLQQIVPATLKKQLVSNTLEETTRNVFQHYKRNTSNSIYRIVNPTKTDPIHSAYSIAALSEISPNRIGQSDLIKIEYNSTDPSVCRQTLELLTQVLTKKHKELFSVQNEAVIGYFDSATREAYNKLQAAERKLFEFNKSNNIVDYDQQIVTSTEENQLAVERRNELEMQYAAASSALKAREQFLKKRNASNLQSQEIVRLRNQLSAVNSQIAELEMASTVLPESAPRLARLKQEAETITGKINETINSYYGSSNSIQGVPVKDLLNDYAKNAAQVEELRSQLNLMRKQQSSSSGKYNSLVPLSADIRKIKREVEVAEQEYISQVEGLKQSKLSQQNVNMASQLKVVDPPYTPKDPETTKLILLIMFGMCSSFFVVAGCIVTSSLLNESLTEPAKVVKVTSFPVIGSLPLLSNSKANQYIDVKKAEDHLTRQLLLRLQQKQNPHTPFVIGVLSSHSGEGKTSVSNTLTMNLNELGIDTLCLLPDDEDHQKFTSSYSSYYSPLQALTPNNPFTLLDGVEVFKHSVIIIEFPALLETIYPTSLLQHLDLILLTIKANRNWKDADRDVYDSIKGVTKAPIEVVLNGVIPRHVEDFVGMQVKKNRGDKPLQLPQSTTDYPKKQELLES
ncbi:hypothetical protein EFA69_00685 [Rufibacter immobilis]|uniref:Polysaccharide chain length determinant N-terminal domain-containing protein n=1 Tax=Rufibacter immobilis TaxID=1348778 RepID=A0A3M9N6Y3_9BACT|nr:hypothetical protein [Rufibacter immobilis]RNI32973.1 hypothetical protein EFA69_00685 [Rufibacter immobilis]